MSNTMLEMFRWNEIRELDSLVDICEFPSPLYMSNVLRVNQYRSNRMGSPEHSLYRYTVLYPGRGAVQRPFGGVHSHQNSVIALTCSKVRSNRMLWSVNCMISTSWNASGVQYFIIVYQACIYLYLRYVQNVQSK